MIIVNFICGGCSRMAVEEPVVLHNTFLPLGWWETADHGLLCPRCVLDQPTLPALAAYAGAT